MSQLLRSLLGTEKKAGKRSKPIQRKCWPQLEALEDRSVPSATALHHHPALLTHHHPTGHIALQQATSGTTGQTTTNQTQVFGTGSGSQATGSHAQQTVTTTNNQTQVFSTGSGSHATGSHATSQAATTNTSNNNTTSTALAGRHARSSHRHHHPA